MLSNDQQEVYRKRYAARRSGWLPSTQVYQNLVMHLLVAETRVLDLGCGRGGIMERLSERARLVMGLDPDFRSLREHREPALGLVCGLARTLPCADRTFDVVCTSWVLEHLPDPALAFSEVRRVLVRGGRFVFLTPNAYHPLPALNRALGWTKGRLVDRFYDRSQSDTFPAFYRANTPARIHQLARSAGFERVSLSPVGDPTYLAFSELLFKLACFLENLTPPPLHVHLVGDYVAR